MSDILRNFRATYLLPRAESATATPELSAGQGWWRHVDTLPGVSESEVVSELMLRGAVPIEIVEAKESSSFLNAISAEHKYRILRALAFNIESGKSAASALTAVVEADSGPVREHLNRASIILQRGGTFYEALVSLDFYDESVLSMLEAGERTGAIRSALRSALAYLDSKKNADLATKAAVGALALDVVISASTIAGNFAVIPAMADPSKIKDAAKAAEVTEIISQLMLANGVMLAITVLFVFVGGVILYAYKGRDLELRRFVDKHILRVPRLGQSIVHSAVASSAKVASNLIASGVDMALAYMIVLKGVKVPRVQDYWQTAARQLELGEPVARSMSQSLLEPSERVLIASHTSRQQLAEALENIGIEREANALREAKRFGKAAFIFTLIYNGIAVLIAIGAMVVQNKAMMANMAG